MEDQSRKPTMAEKEGRQRLFIIRELVKTPKKSLGTPRRVLVDDKGNEVAKTPRKISGTPVLKPQKRPTNSACTTSSKTPCKIQVSPSPARSHLISSKLNYYSQSSRACTLSQLKPPNTACQKDEQSKDERSNVQMNSEMVTEKENIFVIRDGFADKENTPLKEGITSGRTPTFSLRGIISEVSRIRKKENFLRSPALRVELKDSTVSSGRKRKASVQKGDTQSDSNKIRQCTRSNNHP